MTGAHDVAKWLVDDGHAEKMMFEHTTLKGSRASALSPLYAVFMQGWEDVGAAMLKTEAGKAVVDKKNRDGSTALFVTASKGYAKSVDALIAAGANINLSNQNGETALFKAADKGHRAIIAAMIAAGVDLEVKDRQDNTALFRAAAKGHLSAVAELLDAGANPNAKGFAAGDSQGQARMAKMETAAQW